MYLSIYVSKYQFVYSGYVQRCGPESQEPIVESETMNYAFSLLSLRAEREL